MCILDAQRGKKSIHVEIYEKVMASYCLENVFWLPYELLLGLLIFIKTHGSMHLFTYHIYIKLFLNISNIIFICV